MSDPLRIRPATSTDAPALAGLARQVFADTYGARLGPTVLASRLETQLSTEAFRAQMAGPGWLWVAQRGAELLGYLQVAVTETPACVSAAQAVELQKLYVSAAHQGLHVGSALLETALPSLPNHLESLWLLVWEENARAIGFYQRWGFQAVGRQEVFVGDTVFQDLVMSKALGGKDD